MQLARSPLSHPGSRISILRRRLLEGPSRGIRTGFLRISHWACYRKKTTTVISLMEHPITPLLQHAQENAVQPTIVTHQMTIVLESSTPPLPRPDWFQERL